MFAGAAAPQATRQARLALVPTGADVAVSDESGWASLLFATVPPAHAAEYRHFYDRHVGRLNAAPAREKYDHLRAGQVWALLFHPSDERTADPVAGLGHALGDDLQGAYFFRDRWTGKDDLQVSLMGDFRSYLHGGVDTAEAFQIGLRAYGTSFIGGPEQAGAADQVSALLVDQKVYASKADTGAPDRFLRDARGGYVVVDGGKKYRNLGIASAKRHLLVDFSPDQAPSVVATLDHLRAPARHTYTWQLNLGDAKGDGGVRATAAEEGGRPTFTLLAATGGYVKGWVLSPPGATITAADPLQVQTSGSDAEIWVVMAVGRGAPPSAEISGAGLASALRLGGVQVGYDARADRVRASRR
jgi:hypothetical protein